MSGLGDHILDTLGVSLDSIDGVSHVYKRALWPACPSESVLLQVNSWEPVQYCIGGPIGLPSRSNYRIFVQGFVKHTDAEDGREISMNLSERIRVMLHTDESLSTALNGLSDDSSGILERVAKWRVLRQTFFEDEQQGIFGFLSNTELEFETYN